VFPPYRYTMQRASGKPTCRRVAQQQTKLSDVAFQQPVDVLALSRQVARVVWAPSLYHYHIQPNNATFSDAAL